jgi:hypothetical protein
MQIKAADLRNTDSISGSRNEYKIARVRTVNGRVYVRTEDNFWFEYQADASVFIAPRVADEALAIAAEFVDPRDIKYVDGLC